MLSRPLRIDGATISRTLPQSHALHASWGSIRYAPEPTTKITCIISKKVAKTSVDRHRIRRKLYAAVQELDLSVLPSGYYYIFPKALVLHQTHSQIIELLRATLSSLTQKYS